MKVNLYTASVGVFGRGLNGLSTTLKRGADHAAHHGMTAADLLEARLHPTMYSLAEQVQTCCDLAHQASARLAGLDVPPHFEPARDLAGLHAQIDETQAFLRTLTPAQFEGRDEAPISFPIGGAAPVTYPAAQYLLGFVTQNFFFHYVTAYGILRSLGVDLGKKDFFGA